MPTNIKTGSYTGNGAAQNISLGFAPDYVRIVNLTGNVVDEWFSGMAAATSFTNSTDTVAASTRASPNGVTVFQGDASNPKGFSIGPGALSTNASVYRYFASANGPGGM